MHSQTFMNAVSLTGADVLSGLFPNEEMSIQSHSANMPIHNAFCHFFRDSHQYLSCARNTYHPACIFSFPIFNLLMRDTSDCLPYLVFLTRTSTLLETFLLEITALRVTMVLPFERFMGIRVLPLSATAKLYFSYPESMARDKESGHASHAHLISMKSPSAAVFLSVESVSLFFISLYFLHQ